MRYALILISSLLLPMGALAQGSSFKTDFRLIDFNDNRQVCLSSGAALYETHDGPSVGRVEQQVTHRATAISLDQDWVQVEIGQDLFLVRPEDLSFGAC